MGCLAETVSLDHPTMVLNLRNCVDDYHKEFTILHQFGHALGLGHEHQHPEYLATMEKFIDVDAAMDCYGIEKSLWRTEYDVHSIMHFP